MMVIRQCLIDYDRANDWTNNNNNDFPVLHLQNDCSQDCQSNYYAGMKFIVAHGIREL